MKRAALLLMPVVLLVFALMMSPASGQTAIPPEATVENTPMVRLENTAVLTPEPTFDWTAEVMPPGFDWVMHRDNDCVLSPDETLVAVDGVGVFRLPGGEQIIALEPLSPAFIERAPSVRFSEDRSHVFAAGDGVYKISNGEKVISFNDESVVKNVWSGLVNVLDFEGDTWTETLYDLETGETVFPPFTYTSPEVLAQAPVSDPEYIHTESGLSVYGDTLMTYDAQIRTANVYDLATQELLYTREFDGWFLVDPTNTYLAVAGEDVRTLRDNKVVLDNMPPYRLMWLVPIAFSEDGAHVLVDRLDGSYLYSLPDGAQVAVLPLLSVSGGFVVADDGQSLIVTENWHPQPGILRSNTYTLNLSSDEATRGQMISGVPLKYGEPFINLSDSPYLIKSDGIYDSESGELIVAFDGGVENYVFISRDDTLAMRWGDGVYDLISKRKLYDLPLETAIFSPDSRFIWTPTLGVLDARSGEVLYDGLEHNAYTFSASSKYLTILGIRTCDILALPEAQE